MSDDEKDVDVGEEKEDKPVKGGKKFAGKKFEVKKWNAVALWAWGKFSYILRHFFQ